MIAASLFPPVVSLAAIVVSGLLAFIAPKGKRTMAFSGFLLASLGAGFLAIGTIPQRWGGGPPLEGPLATVGALVMIAFAGGLVLAAFLKRSSDDHTQS
jgi:hypothetical protein